MGLFFATQGSKILNSVARIPILCDLECAWSSLDDGLDVGVGFGCWGEGCPIFPPTWLLFVTLGRLLFLFTLYIPSL